MNITEINIERIEVEEKKMTHGTNITVIRAFKKGSTEPTLLIFSSMQPIKLEVTQL